MKGLGALRRGGFAEQETDARRTAHTAQSQRVVLIVGRELFVLRAAFADDVDLLVVADVRWIDPRLDGDRVAVRKVKATVVARIADSDKVLRSGDGECLVAVVEQRVLVAGGARIAECRFPFQLTDRGLAGVRLVISDAHSGLRAAIRTKFQGATWQRCRVHAMRNMMGAAPHQQRQVISALIRTIFAQPDHATASAQLRLVVDQLQPLAPKVAALLEGMEADLLAYTGFPKAHWSKIWSNNPIERLNRELKRRTDVVGIFPDTTSVIRLVGALLVEINDEMIAAERRYISAASVADIDGIEPDLQSLPAAQRD